MFNMFVSVPKRSSTFLSDVKVDLANSKAVAYFQDGSVYGYRFVSKKAILNILFNLTSLLFIRSEIFEYEFNTDSC